jgi:hypothetical protein
MQTGHGQARDSRLVQLAARQLTAVAQPLQGPLTSARSCVQAITIGISHLWSQSFIGPPSAYASAGCVLLRKRIGDALLLFACPHWPSLIRRLEVPCASERRANTKCNQFLHEGIPHPTEASSGRILTGGNDGSGPVHRFRLSVKKAHNL